MKSNPAEILSKALSALSDVAVMAKARVGAYTRKDGTLVKEHDNGRAAAAPGDVGRHAEAQRPPKPAGRPSSAGGAKTQNEGNGFHGEATTAHLREKLGADSYYNNAGEKDWGEARAHADKKFADAADHLVKHGHFESHDEARDYLDSSHGRHLHDGASFHGGDIGKVPWLVKDVKSYKAKTGATGAGGGNGPAPAPAAAPAAAKKAPQPNASPYSVRHNVNPFGMGEGAVHPVKSSPGDAESKLGLRPGSLSPEKGTHYSPSHVVSHEDGSQHSVYASGDTVHVRPLGKTDAKATAALQAHIDGDGAPAPKKAAPKADPYDGHPNIVGRAENLQGGDASKAHGFRFAGKTFSSSGKDGTSFHDGTPVRHFKESTEDGSDSGDHVWMDHKGRVHADAKSDVPRLREAHEAHAKAGKKAKKPGAAD